MKVVINRSDAIGDLILTTPIAKAIKHFHPQAKITFLISKKCEDVVKSLPFIDDYIIIKPHSLISQFVALWNYFRENSPDIYMHLGGKQWPNLVAYLTAIPRRGGLRSKWQTFVFLNKAVRQKRSLVEMHEIDYNLQTLVPLGIAADSLSPSDCLPKFSLSDVLRTQDYWQFVDSLPMEQKHFRYLIVIHPGMTGHTLNWPEANYAALMDKLYQMYGDQVLFLLSHTPSDERYVSAVLSALPERSSLRQRLYLFDGTKKGLLHYMHILSHAHVFVGPSTGTTHIANLLSIPTIGIYSPIKVQSAKRWGPAFKNDRLRLHIPEVVCGERFHCAGEACPYFPCMGVISVDEVVQSVNDLINKR